MSHTDESSRRRDRATAGGSPTTEVEQVVVGDRGRLVLPAGVRAQLGLIAGTRLLLSTEADGSIRLRPYRAVADAGRGLLAGFGGSGSMVDELLAERRAAAAVEDAVA
jgi:AbrB family looped-hinge helix DNA binding protein